MRAELPTVTSLRDRTGSDPGGHTFGNDDAGEVRLYPAGAGSFVELVAVRVSLMLNGVETWASAYDHERGRIERAGLGAVELVVVVATYLAAS